MLCLTDSDLGYLRVLLRSTTPTGLTLDPLWNSVQDYIIDHYPIGDQQTNPDVRFELLTVDNDKVSSG